DVAYLFEIVDRVIAARRGAPGDDLLGLMLASSLDRVHIRHQILTLLVAGYESTSAAMAFALYFLANDPGASARARAEVDAMWGDTERPAFEQVSGLRYIRRVIDESLRLWPTAPGYSRAARQDTVLGGAYPMRAGEGMFVLSPALHRDPVWGADPER